MFPMLALMAGSALLNARQAEQKRQQQQRYNQGQAEVTRYSPWTNMQGQLDNSFIPDALTAGATGALQGAAIGQAFGGMGGAGGGQKPAPTGSSWDNLDASQNLQMPQFGSSYNPGIYGR